MFLLDAVFAFNVMCYLTPCELRFKPPEILETPQDPAVLAHNSVLVEKPPVVQTPNGQLEGYFMKAINGRLFMAFEGIPYGEAKRWKLPTPAKPWSGVRPAKHPGPACLQVSPMKLFRVWGQEHCLFLNVYTPRLPETTSPAQFPVIVYIPGGAFQLDSAAGYGSSYILAQDAVVVTLNYRLGVLGFATTADEHLPANLGLKDQALALKWVFDNISRFGGNPQNITLMGQSAGGVSVSLHMISNKTRDYFSSAIASSGNAFVNWAVQPPGKLRQFLTRLAKNVGCGEGKDSRRLVNCLRKVDVNLLVARQISLFDWFPFPPVIFGPTVERQHPDAFLTTYPLDAYRAGTVAKKPLIVSTTKEEGQTNMLLLMPLLRTIPLRVMWDQIAPVYLGLHGVDKDQVVKRVSQFYFQGNTSRNVDFRQFSKMLTDRYFLSGFVQALQAHVSLGAPTYSYLFSYSDGNRNIGNMLGYRSHEWGAEHIEDTSYFFNVSNYKDALRQTDTDYTLSQFMINLVINFAKTGKPLYETQNGTILNVWEPMTDPSKPKMLQFDKHIKMISLPEDMVTRLRFWEGLSVPNMTLLYHLK